MMGDPPDPRVVAANLHKRRGVAKASVAHLITRVGKLKGETDLPNIRNTAKLQEASAEFKQAHLSLVDRTDGNEALATE